MYIIFLKIVLLTAIVLFSHSLAFARIVMTAGDEMELVGGCGVFQFNQSSGAYAVDSIIPSVSYSTKAIDNYLMETDALEDYGVVSALPQFLTWLHDRYFVSVSEEGSVMFKVKYQDEYNNPPSDGYPKAIYWKQGTQDYQDVILDADSGVYCKSMNIPVGKYCYRYTVQNNYLNSEYSLAVSSFVVTSRPLPAMNPSVQDNQTVTNGKVHLRWDAAGSSMRYKLYLGVDPLNLSVVFEGTDPAYDVAALAPAQLYYWQVETINEFGVSSKSSLLRFTTLGAIAKSYSYPNPFNPSRGESANIVFMMDENGSAEITVYSEFGDHIWQKQVDGLFQGTNEIAYDGHDDAGNQLYNGTYVCSIVKKYSGRETRERCRLLVIK